MKILASTSRKAQKPLTEEELLELIDNLSDLSYCSGGDIDAEDDIWENIGESMFVYNKLDDKYIIMLFDR